MKRGRPKLPPKINRLPKLRLDMQQISLMADRNPDILTVESDVNGVMFAYDKGGVVLIRNDQYFMLDNDEWRVILEELKWVVGESEKWARA